MIHDHVETVPYSLRLPGWRPSKSLGRPLGACEREAWYLAMVGCVDHLHELLGGLDVAGGPAVCQGMPHIHKPGVLPLQYEQAMRAARGVDPVFVRDVCLPTARRVRCSLLRLPKPGDPPRHAPGRDGWLLPINTSTTKETK